MNPSLRFLFVAFFSVLTISAFAQRVPNLQNSSTQRLGNGNPHTALIVDSLFDYVNTEQSCMGWIPSIFIWRLDSRATGIDTMILTDAGETFDTLIDATCTPMSISLPARISAIDYYIGHSNFSGLTDTIVFYIEDINPVTKQPNGTLIWTDTLFTSISISPSGNWLNAVNLQRYPNVLVSGYFFAGIRYYGAATDTFGILASGYEMIGNGSMEATFGKAFRKHAGQSSWRPDPVNPDYYYDMNVNNVYDVGMSEAFPFQTVLISPTISHYATIDGTVFKDINMNGIFDSGEPPRPNTIVTAGTFSASTDANGYFILRVDSGNFTVQPVIQGYFTVSTAPVNVAATAPQAYNAGDFATNDIPNVNDLQINATRHVRYVPGFSDIMSIAYYNNGTTTLSGTVKYVPDSLALTISVVPAPTGTNGDTLLWAFSNLLPGQWGFMSVHDSISPTTPIGTPIHYYTEIQPIPGDTVPTDNLISVNDTVRGSFDPNDKTPFPAGTGPQGEISSTQKLTFLVRFQNTGTYPAQTVIVVDTLEAGFDITTFDFISSSHPCTWSLNSNRSVTFTFSNIMLADSNSNEPASHGFLKYSILPDTGIAPGTQLNNTAYIYFDFNTAVITNTTLNTIAVPNNTQEILVTGNTISVFPNPFSETFSISWDANKNEQPSRLLLCDITGRIVREIPVSGQQVIVLREGLQNGLYFFRLETASGKNYAVGKIIAQ